MILFCHKLTYLMSWCKNPCVLLWLYTMLEAKLHGLKLSRRLTEIVIVQVDLSIESLGVVSQR